MSAQDPRFMQALARALAEMQGLGGLDPTQGAAERAYEQDAARSRQQYGMFNDGSPNALQGGVPSRPSPPHPFASFVVDSLTGAGYPEDYLAYGPRGSGLTQQDAVQRAEAVGLPGSAIRGPGQEFYGGPSLAPGAANYDTAPQPEALAPLAAEGMEGIKTAPKAKKKGEFSHFFQLLKQAKAEGKGGATSKAFKDLAKQLGKESDPTAAQGTVSVT